MFYGGARSGKTDVISAWLWVQAATYPGARILMARRTRIAAEKSLLSDSLVKILRGRRDFKLLESDLEIRHGNGSLIRVDDFDDQERVDKSLGTDGYSPYSLGDGGARPSGSTGRWRRWA